MNKVIGVIGVLALASGLAFAESITVSVTATNRETAYSAALPVHGVIDKVEYVKTGNSQADIVVASYDGTTAIDTFVSKLNLAAGTKRGVVRPRVIGTDTAGTDLTYGSALQLTNVTQVLVAAYEAPMAGGNVKVCVVNDETTNVTATVTIFFKPVQR